MSTIDDIDRAVRAGALTALLNDVRQFIRRFVVLTDDQAVIVALWVLHTYAFDAAEATPYLSIHSPEKRSGKTRLLEVLKCVANRPWMTGKASAAVLTRKVDKERPTLLLDESDATFNQDNDYSEALRGLLNTGYSEDGMASMCVGQGANLSYKDFSTFCPKAIAGIGTLPDTIRDRSVAITLKRRRRTEKVERLRRRKARIEAAPLREALAAWVTPVVLELLREAYPDLPDALNDRAMDVMEPLVAIADLAGADWPTRARSAAVGLLGDSTVEDDSVGVQLLTDIRVIFDKATMPASLLDGTTAPQPADAMFSKVLREGLHGLEDRPWSSWGKTKFPITGQAIAMLLRGFGVVTAGTIRIGAVTGKGYRRTSFEDAWERYLTTGNDANAESGTETPNINNNGRLAPVHVLSVSHDLGFDPSHGNNTNKYGPEVPIFEPSQNQSVTVVKTPVSSITTGLSDHVTIQNPDHESEVTESSDENSGTDIVFAGAVYRESDVVNWLQGAMFVNGQPMQESELALAVGLDADTIHPILCRHPQFFINTASEDQEDCWKLNRRKVQ